MDGDSEAQPAPLLNSSMCATPSLTLVQPEAQSNKVSHGLDCPTPRATVNLPPLAASGTVEKESTLRDYFCKTVLHCEVFLPMPVLVYHVIKYGHRVGRQLSW